AQEDIVRLKEMVQVLEDREGVAAKQSGDDAPIKGRTTVLAGGIDVPTGSGSIPTAGPSATVISTSTEVGSTTSPIVTSYSRRKGKEVMVESDTPKKQRLQEQDNYSKVYKFQSQQRRPMTKKQKREYYMAMIRNNLGWKVKDFKGLTFEEIEAKFAEVWKQVEDFIPIGSKEETERLKRKVEWKLYDLSRVHHLTAKDKEIFMLVEKDYPLIKGLALVMISYKLQVENYSQMAEDMNRKIYNIANTPRRLEMPMLEVCTAIEEKKKKLPVKDRWQLKRKGLNLEQEHIKKQKSSEEASEIEKSTKEITEEKMKEMMQLVPVEDVYVQALQVKHPVIDWKVHTEGQRSYWKIIRLGGSSACYQFFIDLLKQLDREDLNQLWALVKEYLSIRPATSKKEMELWVELKRLYELDPEDQLWTQTQNFMHAPVEWKLYDLSGVHHMTAKDKEIFMLVEKDYPLRKGLALMMISYKLHIENYLQMAEDLIRKIYNIANTPGQHVKIVATARRNVKPLPEVFTAIEEKKKKLPVKDRWQLHKDSASCLAHDLALTNIPSLLALRIEERTKRDEFGLGLFRVLCMIKGLKDEDYLWIERIWRRWEGFCTLKDRVVGRGGLSGGIRR
nr:hypothetical protein [Tanacetum cinerariifolium]